ncbi:type IV pilus assembly protein PilV [Halomonas fontilapidosi]|uniref:Type IV pilus assembly protein PilV n=1 Tax=Halomonas fontilapidosi TaxID=616675 RepID=A0A7W5H0A8_9GAMM|nr:type IV pilus modification protein PilV [Halomonas fontilapidosi]MBB3185465.1 type IV pilus assembly protein PilV [Halomonas fontilapidosi]
MLRRQSFKTRGFTLIEALVALLVLSIGLLGLAMMQVKAMKSAHVAYQRSIATIAAQDMVERLWVELGRGAPASIVCPEATATVPPTSETILFQWHKEWEKSIPSLVMDSDGSSGTQTVVKDGSVACKYTITVQWEDERFGDEDVSELVYVASLIGVDA